MGTVTFFSGLPKAGKSVTLAALYRRLRLKNRSFFLERVCPDCEGIWTAESGDDAGGIARAHKNRLKDAGEFFSPAFVEAKCKSLSGLARVFAHVLADMGGIPSAQNGQIVAAALATGADVRSVLMVPQNTDPAEWSAFWRSRRIEPLKVTTNFGGSIRYQELAEQYASALEEQF